MRPINKKRKTVYKPSYDKKKAQTEAKRMQDEFRKKFKESTSESRLVLALDVKERRKAFSVLEAAGEFLAAVKVHPEHALLWGLGHAEAVKQLKRFVPCVILDAKLADIDSSNAMKAEYYFAQGYDAIICHAFPGRKAVQAVIGEADKASAGVFVLNAMTSEGHLFSEANVDALSQIIRDVNPAGVIAPGNQYALLARIRRNVGPDKIILSPGVGFQGGAAGDAVKAGADYAIVGRAVVGAEDPAKAAKELRDAMNEVIK